MVSHPPVEAFLAGAEGDRARARADFQAYLLEQAKAQLKLYGLSRRCETLMQHSNVPLDKHDCKNDGSGCLCECHDDL